MSGRLFTTRPLVAPSPGPPAPRAPRGLIGMLGLVLVVELAIGVRGSRYGTDQALSWKLASEAAEFRSARCGVLCFGDSLVKFGIVPQVIEQRTGQAAYNLAVHNGPPAASYFLLRRALAAGARPSAVIVDFLPHQLARDPRNEEFRQSWPELLSTAECVDLARQTGDTDFFAGTMLARLLPSYRYRLGIRTQVVAALERRDLPAVHMLPALRRNWEANRGAQLLAPKKKPWTGYEWADDEPLPDPWRSDPVSLAYAERFLDLAAAHQIAVFWILPPITRASPARRQQLDAAYTRFVERVRNQYANLVVIDGRRSRYQHDCYVDPVHLQRAGSVALSLAVGDAMTAAPPVTRWTPLPDYRASLVDVPLEDVNQSRQALHRKADRRVR